MKIKQISLLAFSVLFLTACTANPNQVTKSSSPKTVIETTQLKQQTNPYQINYDDIDHQDLNLNLDIISTTQSINGKELNRYMYTNERQEEFPAGYPIILKENQALNLTAYNKTDVETNIHWHGLSLPNDQDGPAILIKPNQDFTYHFTPGYSGTYWYHSHNRPVRDQVDNGMYGPLVILSETDKDYDLDQILVLDDWVVNQKQGHMQIEGDTDTVNGLTKKDMIPLQITNKDKVKFRLIQASTAKNTTVNFPFTVNVTHTDGLPLDRPYETNTLELSPGERFDVEFILDEPTSMTYHITNERDNGFDIPIDYEYIPNQTNKKELTMMQHSARELPTTDKKDMTPITVNMDSQMSRGRGHEWTINGDVFPDAETFDVKVGEPYLITFNNQNRMNNHPMHIHGAHFKLMSIAGKPVNETIWKDTIDVLPGESVEVAIVFDSAGEWMLHCHILDHEDGGMMTSIIAS